MKSQKSVLRRWFPIVSVSLMSVLALSCAPAVTPVTTTVPPPPAARAVLSVSSGVGGSYVQVAPSDGSCLAVASRGFVSMRASLTVPGSGVVLSSAYQYLSPDGLGLSSYGNQDQFVSLKIPDAINRGEYNVFLSCFSYADQYSYEPASFTVTTTSTTTTTTTTTLPPAPALSGATQVEAGYFSTCSLVSGGAVKCWGYNGYGQLGDGTYNYSSSVPVDVVGVSGATQVEAGQSHSCAVVSGGAVKCWGFNSSGQLGDGTTDSLNVPVDVVGVSGATRISAGANNTCAVVSGGAVKCWGSNQAGQLGDGTTSSYSSVPVDVVGVSGATQVAIGQFHSCAVVSGGAVKCWGFNSSGQLGDGTTDSLNVPVDVVGVSGATQISAGSFHSCAVVSGGAVKCWGSNGNGELGDGTTSSYSSVPVDVVGVLGATRISAGDGHSCALVSGGAVKCWGYNGYGALGDGTYNYSSSVPVDVVGVSDATQISVGGFHSCALVSGGGVKCWGANYSGQLGNGPYGSSNVPVDVLAG